MIKNIVWEEKYRPSTIDECIMPKDTKKFFMSLLKKGDLPNLLLSGPPGTGKTTAALALCNQLNYETLVINGSNEGRFFDTLRTKITNFASQMTLTGQQKCVIIDEADYLPQETIQPALRNFMDEFSRSNVKFIFTCNYPNKIIEALRSRMAGIDFKIPKEEALPLMGAAAKRIKFILNEENVTIDSDTILLKLVKNYFPDMRRLVNEIQFKTGAGSLESGALTGVVSTELKVLIKHLSDRNAKSTREWVAAQPYLSIEDIVQDLYHNMNNICSKETMAQFIAIIADWSYKSNFMPDAEIAIVAMLVDLMVQCELSAIIE
jgi:DNA polymerase III delta prime subunit